MTQAAWLLAYWGRRGAGPTLTEAMLRAAQADPDLEISLSYSRQGERSQDLAQLTPNPLPIDTFSGLIDAGRAILRLPALHRNLAKEIRERQIDWVVTIMPHLWGPILASATHRGGARYCVIVHDATAHPGEESWLLDQIGTAEIKAADRIIACSDHVARQLVARHGPLPITTLFHPPFDFGRVSLARTSPQNPLRLLFFGRILPYKGVPMLLDAYHLLRKRGVSCTLSIVGDGSIEGLDVSDQGVSVHNHWIQEAEIPGFLEDADVLVAPYLESSQSGVIAAAQAAGLPCVATPVGGLIEQIDHGLSGLIAQAATPDAVADAIQSLVETPGLYARCSAGALAEAQSKGWPVFIDGLKAALTPTP
jgi:glycosyltransferase involved in cell wall biosynthesis